MGYIFGVILVLIIFVVLRAVSRGLMQSTDQYGKEQYHRYGQIVHRISNWFLVAILILVTFFAVFHQIPFGHVAILKEFGAIKGQVSEGPQFVFPWRSVMVANVQITSHKFAKLTCFSIETQEVFVDATLNIRVSPTAIQNLYRRVGPNFFEVVVAPRLAQNFKDETVKYKSVDIAPNRENIRHSVRRRLEGELYKDYSIEVVDLLLDNIDFNPDFKKAIEAKQVATQRALEEQQKVVVERHRAEQVVEKAKGQGESILVMAEKQAKANERLNATLTPALIKYTMIQKLSDKIQIMLLPAGQDFILGSDILKGLGGKGVEE